jgi:hypothetical protein
LHSANKKIPTEEDRDADPSDPYVFGPPGSRSGSIIQRYGSALLSSYKNSKKNLDSYCFVILFDFLSLKNDVNLPSKSNKNFFVKIKFFVGILKVNDENSRIRIHQSETWIRGSGSGSTPKCHGSATLEEENNR